MDGCRRELPAEVGLPLGAEVVLSSAAQPWCVSRLGLLHQLGEGAGGAGPPPAPCGGAPRCPRRSTLWNWVSGMERRGTKLGRAGQAG